MKKVLAVVFMIFIFFASCDEKSSSDKKEECESNCLILCTSGVLDCTESQLIDTLDALGALGDTPAGFCSILCSAQ